MEAELTMMEQKRNKEKVKKKYIIASVINNLHY